MEDNVSTRNFVLGSAMLLPLFFAKPAQAQRVNADITIGGGPIAGRVSIGDRGYRPRPIGGIEWIRSGDYRRNDWWGNFERGSRLVVVYYDPYDDAYYLDRFSPDLIELRLFERGGRFYRLEDDGYGFPGYIRGYTRYVPRYQAPRNYSRYETPRYDNRRYDNDRRDGRSDGRRDARGDDRRGDDRREVRGDDRRDNRADRDNRGARGNQGNRGNQDNRDHRGQGQRGRGRP